MKFGRLLALEAWAVYKSRDTRLNREIAIKTLPSLFAADAVRLPASN